MKISIIQENVKKGISIVSHAAGKNPNLPILSNVLFDVKGGEIKLVATNLEIGIVNKVRGKIDKDGSITVDAKMISDYISLLPNQKVSIEVLDNDLRIESENYKTKIIGQAADDFPLIPEVNRESGYSANVTEFKRALSNVVFATSSSEVRLELTGVLFCFKGDELVMAATDSFRLSEVRVKISGGEKKEVKEEGEEDSDDGVKFIVPSKTLQELSRVLSIVSESDLEDGEENEIKFYVADNQILFSFANTELVSRLIEGQFPDYTQIIPKLCKTQVSILKADLVRAIKASAIFSKNGVNDINLDFPAGKNKVVVSASSGAQGENVVEVEADSKGDDNGVVVNYKYLLDGLNAMDSDRIDIEVVDNNTPCIVKGKKDEGFLYIVMPIKQ